MVTNRKWLIFVSLFFLAAAVLTAGQTRVQASELAQLPTGSIPTVTSTASGPMAFVLTGNEPQANLRSGPGQLYDRVGVLLAGQSAPAKGRSPGNEWILVEYPGIPGGLAWVYAPLVEIRPSVQLPIVEPPPSPTPAVTTTIDPTLAARFIVTEVPTRLPTFTAPPPLNVPTFQPEQTPSLAGIPMAVIILGLAALGVFFGVIAFAQGR